MHRKMYNIDTVMSIPFLNFHEQVHNVLCFTEVHRSSLYSEKVFRVLYRIMNSTLRDGSLFMGMTGLDKK